MKRIPLKLAKLLKREFKHKDYPFDFSRSWAIPNSEGGYRVVDNHDPICFLPHTVYPAPRAIAVQEWLMKEGFYGFIDWIDQKIKIIDYYNGEEEVREFDLGEELNHLETSDQQYGQMVLETFKFYHERKRNLQSSPSIQ